MESALTRISFRTSPDVSPALVCTSVISSMSRNGSQFVSLSVEQTTPTDGTKPDSTYTLAFERSPEGSPEEEVVVLVIEKGIVSHLDAHPPLTSELRARIIGFKPDEAIHILAGERWEQMSDIESPLKDSYLMIFVRDVATEAVE